MLAKQWLQEYARTEKTGSMEEQVKRRAEKFAGAEKWGLRAAVEALPLLLLVSLTLFLYALTDYLFGVNHTAAYVVLGFTVAGAVLYALTVIAAVAFPACPYRTPVSSVILSARAAVQYVLYSKDFLRRWPTPYSVIWDLPFTLTVRLGERVLTLFPLSDQRRSKIDRKLRMVVSRSFRNTYNGIILLSIFGGLVFAWSFVDFTLASLVLLFLLFWPEQRSDDPALLVRSAMWMVETSPTPKHVLTIAHNIPLITNFRDMQLVATSPAFASLLSKFTKILLRARRDSTKASSEDAATIGRAVAYVLLADPEQSSVAVGDACLAGLGDWEPNKKLEGVWDSDLKHLFEAIVTLCCAEKTEEDISPLVDPIGYERAARLRSLMMALSRALDREFRSSLDATIYLRQCVIMGFHRFHKPHAQHHSTPPSDIPLLPPLSLKGAAITESYLSCVSRTLSERLRLQSPKAKKLSIYNKAKLAWVNPTQ